MKDRAYIQGVLTALGKRLQKEGVDPGMCGAFSVEIDESHQVVVRGTEAVADHVQGGDDMCRLIAVGRACLDLTVGQSSEAAVLSEEFDRLERVCLYGRKRSVARKEGAGSITSNPARAKARQLAEWHWKRGMSDPLTHMASLVARELVILEFFSRGGEPYCPATVWRWIRPLAPIDRYPAPSASH